MDKTIHDLAVHIEKEGEEVVAKKFNEDGTSRPDLHGRVGHTKEWYEFWNAAKPICPACGAPANVK